jgi:hypothetical protein
MTVYVDVELFKIYHVSGGPGDAVPRRIWHVDEKSDWGRVWGSWIGLDVPGASTGFRYADALARRETLASHGCIRMRDEEPKK